MEKELVTLRMNRYISRLKKYSEYSTKIKHKKKFVYQSQKDQSVQELRETLRLDDIASGGDEEERALALMAWVNDQVIHDGSSDFTGQRNAKTILDYIRSTKQGVNCNIIAIILNDVLLCAGYHSRIVSCMPSENNYFECHALNIAYIKSKKKWILLDATIRAYIRDSTFSLTGIREMREALIHDREIHLNNDMRWNGKPYSEDEYLAYMSKNLFRFASPLISKIDYLSDRTAPTQVAFLNPQKYQKTSIHQEMSDNGEIDGYYTTDSHFFWEDPM